jgi:NADPH:quinone reductase
MYGLSPGDHVAYSGESTYASYAAIPAAKAVKVPSAISLQDAAAGPIQALTAWTMLHESHAVKKGDWILVTAAAGGVGQWLVQMGKYLGARVIAACSTTKVDLARKLGADEVIDYTTTEDYVKPVMEITGGEGVVAVYDGVGKATFDRSLACVARKGTMVSYGNASGAVEPFSIL